MSYLLLPHLNDQLEPREERGPRLIIGRGPQSNLRLEHDAVAIEHASIDEEDKRYVLTDRGSVTGTYVNGKRIEKVQLAAGDEIAIGPFVLKAEFLQESTGPLVLNIRQIGGSAGPKQGAVESQKTDYAAAHELSRTFLNKTVLTWFFTVFGLVVVAGILFAGATRVFQPGALSDAHSFFSHECFRCHAPWHGPSAKACQECHPGPPHHEGQATASCLSCHAEHRSKQSLAYVAKQQCVTCHADLTTKQAKPSRFEKKVTDFTRDHPEFAIAVKTGADEKRLRLSDQAARGADPSRIKFNHQKHGPNADVPVPCADCHLPDIDGRFMAPVKYEAHCKQCHELDFDAQLPNRHAPHMQPEFIHNYLIGVYSELRQGQNVREVEAGLFRDVCTICHEMNLNSRPFPTVEKPAIPAVWLPYARFAHKPHRMLRCVACHPAAAESAQASDVLLPSINVCLNCHRKAESSIFKDANAGTDCVVCHIYHKAKDTKWDGPFLFKGPATGPQGLVKAPDS